MGKLDISASSLMGFFLVFFLLSLEECLSLPCGLQDTLKVVAVFTWMVCVASHVWTCSTEYLRRSHGLQTEQWATMFVQWWPYLHLWLWLVICCCCCLFSSLATLHCAGQMFEESAEKMYDSFRKVKSLPPNTLIFPGEWGQVWGINILIRS